MVGCVWLIVAIFAHFAPPLILANDEGSFSASTNARYACGIRKRFGRQLIHNGSTAGEGQWPWHTALFHDEKYICGGTLIDQRHVLTSAHCVSIYIKRNSTHLFRIYLGLHMLDEFPEQVQLRSVSEVSVHPEYQKYRNDIALLLLAKIVEFSEFVIPICLIGSRVAKVEDLVGKRGWVAGWGMTETGKLAKELKTAQMPVVNDTECVQSDRGLFGAFVAPTMFCASDLNGTSVCQGDSGGGMYFLAGDRWELRGIVSFAGWTVQETCDTGRYVVFTNVPIFLEWIKRLTGGTVTKEDIVPKRLSERKCLEYQKIARRQNSGVCLNARSPHTVAIIDSNQRHISSGSIISEKFVLTKAPNLMDIFELDVDWDELKVRVGNLPDKDILRDFSHPDYDSDTYRHHVMLLELKTSLIFTSGLLPACLANEATENLYDILLLNGYTGQNSVNSTVNDYYERNDNKVITSESCKASAKAARLEYSINPEEFCSRFETDERFSWSGIVGGPLQTVNTRSCMYTIVGITKLLILPDEGKTVYTNVYSRVAEYVGWIERVVWGNEAVSEDIFEGSGEAPMVEEGQRAGKIINQD